MNIREKVLTHKIEIYEGIKNLIIEVLVEIISGVISKLISGVPGRQQPEAQIPA